MKGKQDVEEEHVINTPIFFLLVWSLKIVHSNAGQMLTYLKAGHIEYIYRFVKATAPAPLRY